MSVDAWSSSAPERPARELPRGALRCLVSALLLVGQTDTSGRAGYNNPLSLERTEAFKGSRPRSGTAGGVADSQSIAGYSNLIL